MSDENLARQSELALDRQGNHDSLCYEGRWHSSGSLAGRAARFATGLADLGVRPGDRVLVLMANCPEVLITYSAAWRAGAVVTPLLFLVSEDELRHALADSGAVGVVTTVEFLPKVAGALAGAPGVRFVIVPGVTADTPNSAAPGVPVLDFDSVASADPGSIADRSGTDLAALLYTGGTTGRSKGVPLTHANLFWCGSAASGAWERAGINSMVLPLPLAHAYGLLVFCGGMHRTAGTRSILMRWFDPAGWVRLAAEHRAQSSAGPLDDPDAAQPAAGGGRSVRADRRLVGGGAAGRGGPAGVRGAGADRDGLRGIRVHRGGDADLRQCSRPAPRRQRRAARGRVRGLHPGRRRPGGPRRTGRGDLRPVARRDVGLLARAGVGRHRPRERVAAHRGHRAPGRRRLPLRGGPEEGPDPAGRIQRLPAGRGGRAPGSPGRRAGRGGGAP